MGYSNWIDIKANTLKLRETYGDPRLRNIVVEDIKTSELTTIEPKCIVTKPPYNLLGLLLETRSNIQIEDSDFYIKSVPRSYPRELFKHRIWIDAIIVNDVVYGISGRVHHIDDKKGLSFNLIVKKDVEQKRLLPPDTPISNYLLDFSQPQNSGYITLI